jgi:hypothetical protein
MEKTRQTCSYCLGPLQGVLCRHCDFPHETRGCTLCEMAVRELERLLQTMRR